MSYILTVVAAAMLAAIVKELAGSGTMGALVKFLAGLFVALTVLSPLVKLELPDVQGWMDSFGYDGQSAAEAGAEMAEEMNRSLIKEQVEAYILDKAARYGAALQADVKVNEAGMPVSVTLRGSISPGTKAALTRIIQEDLGLDEEVQHWIA